MNIYNQTNKITTEQIEAITPENTIHIEHHNNKVVIVLKDEPTIVIDGIIHQEQYDRMVLSYKDILSKIDKGETYIEPKTSNVINTLQTIFESLLYRIKTTPVSIPEHIKTKDSAYLWFLTKGVIEAFGNIMNTLYAIDSDEIDKFIETGMNNVMQQIHLERINKDNAFSC